MKSWLKVLCVMLLGAAASLAHAQAYPAKPVRLIVPFPPGGPADGLGRLLAEKLKQSWGESVVIENRGGAAGNIGAELVAKSAPDGYTLLLNASSHVINGSLYEKLPYDPLKDFTAISGVASYMLVVVVHPSVPVNSLRELVALARSRPISTANTGPGTPTHLTAVLFAQAAGIELVHVAYKGAGPANTDLLGGHVMAMFNNPVNALPQMKAQKLRALAVTGANRLALAPEVPTVAESGYPGFEAGTWYGLFAPAGLPAEILAKISEHTLKVLAASDVREKLAPQGWDVIASSPGEFNAFIRSENEKWSRVVKSAGIKPD
jgi:tripartite-type tricarboxylate transporter receptor subunit TctC